MLFNPLAIIINQNKLTRPNYVDWKINLDIVLTTKGYKYILTEKHPDLPIANAPRPKIEIYEKWVKLMRWHIVIFLKNGLKKAAGITGTSNNPRQNSAEGSPHPWQKNVAGSPHPRKNSATGNPHLRQTSATGNPCPWQNNGYKHPSRRGSKRVNNWSTHSNRDNIKSYFYPSFSYDI